MPKGFWAVTLDFAFAAPALMPRPCAPICWRRLFPARNAGRGALGRALDQFLEVLIDARLPAEDIRADTQEWETPLARTQ
jgi:hypothetical protein